MFLPQSERRRRRLVDWPAPTLLASQGLRRIRQLRRLARWKTEPRSFTVPPIQTIGECKFVHFEKAIPLRRCGSDPRLENGKAINVALAAIALNGRALSPGRVFSFWRTVGQPTRARGFALGKEVRAGCVVPTRFALVQAAWAFWRTKPNDPVIKWAEAIAERRGRQIAVVALAAKLARIMFAILRDQKNYLARST